MKKTLTPNQTEIVKAIAKNDGKLAQVAREFYMHRSTITYHSKRIKKLTGLDPRIGSDLEQLLQIIEKENRNG